MFGMGQTTKRVERPLSGADRVPDDVVHRELDEFCPLLAPTLALRADLGQPAPDVGNLQRAQLVFEIEVLCDQRLDFGANGGTRGLGSATVGSLLRACVGFQ